LIYQELKEENLDQKSPGTPGWVLMQQASPPLIGKRKLIKSPLEIVKWAQEGVSTLSNLLYNNNSLHMKVKALY